MVLSIPDKARPASYRTETGLVDIKPTLPARNSEIFNVYNVHYDPSFQARSYIHHLIHSRPGNRLLLHSACLVGDWSNFVRGYGVDPRISTLDAVFQGPLETMISFTFDVHTTLALNQIAEALGLDAAPLHYTVCHHEIPGHCSYLYRNLKNLWFLEGAAKTFPEESVDVTSVYFTIPFPSPFSDVFFAFQQMITPHPLPRQLTW